MVVRALKERLIFRNLDRNQLNGGIPAEIGNLVNLLWLYEFLKKVLI